MRLAALLFVGVLLASCGRAFPGLRGVDLAAWKADRNACDGTRAVVADTVIAQKDSLLFIPEDRVIENLGHPDRAQLLAHSEKMYYYFLRPGPPCGDSTAAVKLCLRFNSMGTVREVTIE